MHQHLASIPAHNYFISAKFAEFTKFIIGFVSFIGQLCITPRFFDVYLHRILVEVG